MHSQTDKKPAQVSHGVIQLRGVRVNNLQDIDVSIPLNSLTVITGVSGAGKSSLAFDTLYAEAHHRYAQSLSLQIRQYLDQTHKPNSDYIGDLPPAIAIGLPQRTNRGSTVGTITELVDYFRHLFCRAGLLICHYCGAQVRQSATADVVEAAGQLEAGTRFIVAFPCPANDGETMEEQLAYFRQEGFVRVQHQGKVQRIDDIQSLTPAASDDIWILVDRLTAGQSEMPRVIDSIETAFNFGNGRMALLFDERQLVFEQQTICPGCKTQYPQLEPRLLDFNDAVGACRSCEGTGKRLKKRKAKSAKAETCAECQGSRLSVFARSISIAGRNLAQVCSLEIGDLTEWTETLSFPAAQQKECRLLLDQIARRLRHMKLLHLNYLSLERPANSLSAGETQRVRLVSALASQLVNALYILDEPATGLHPSEKPSLLRVLGQLRDNGNTLVVVENHAEVVRCADWVIDLGPGAGEQGGRVGFQGPFDELVHAGNSVTAQYLSGSLSVPATKPRETNQGKIELRGASIYNIKDLEVEVPLGVLCVVTGVSGAGKSTLLEDILYPKLQETVCNKDHGLAHLNSVSVMVSGELNDVVLMDRRLLPRSGRSNPATYIKVFDDIRRQFANTTDAKVRNFDAGAFSFNQPGGRCETCLGNGFITVDMQFLADIHIVCPDCKGDRYQKEILDVTVRSLNIAEVLNLTAREAFRFFRAQPAIQRRLKSLLDVGLDYLRLGQSTDTLSGGECQRLKLAGHLAGSRKSRCLFLLDEPSSGLHRADVARLLECFRSLLQAGHSLIVSDNDLDVIRSAEHVIELGPGGGKHGGRIVAAGTPEEVARVTESATGRALRLARG